MEGFVLFTASFIPAIVYELAQKNNETEPEDSVDQH